MKARESQHEYLFKQLADLTRQITEVTEQQKRLSGARITVIRKLHQFGYSHGDIAGSGLNRARIYQLLNRPQPKGRP